jgi:hypothetical protein
MFRCPRALTLAIALVALAPPAFAQRTAPPVSPTTDDWTHGTTISLAGGVATGSSDTGALLGGAVGWELRPRLAVEAGGSWLDRAEGAEAFAAAINVRAGLARSGVSPFVEGGFGLFHFSPKQAGSLPDFYRRRVAARGGLVKPFTDPMFHVGGGVNLFTSRRLAVQPAIEAMVVTRDGHAYTLAAVSLRVAYHFEDHPVTLAR